uniref:Si:ch211-91p5.3 n=1 Tax=Cyprinus carpio carpio TaxID=630221 RepID=A0A9J8BNW7_CYPCA
MSSTQSYSRFSDENYKNWLKTTESLYILRSRIQDFIEKETETYHNSLRNKPHLNGQTCTRSCKLTNKPVCQSCEYWKNEIIANHNGKGNSIHWDNCRPNLWPTDKWEVAKAHMPRGHNKHCKFDQFDIAAILNLMYSCKHFKNIPGKSVVDVISVRNQMMHSPDFKVSNEDMEKHHKTVLQLAEKLQPHIPEMKDLEKKITQFHNTLDKNFNQAPCEVDGQLEDLQTMKDFQKVLDREQQAIKDRIEDFFSRFEGNQDENVKDMKSLMDFLDQNKDLLENLGPEVDKLKEMKAKVDEHEEQINNLTGRVDQLEKVTHDPVIPGNLLRYKNHLYEYCQSKKWAEVKFPVFTEDQESQGYRGKVTVNGQSFTGRKVFNDKKAAHQEVAYIALELLKLQEESTDEPSSSVIQPDASSSSSSGIPFFGKVTVDLDREVVSDRCSSKEEATEATYKVLWESFRISAPVEAGQTYRTGIMEYFNIHDLQKPTEEFFDDENTTVCKLKLNGPFTFYDKDGSTKKKYAEQQAAKVALQHLSGILNYAPISDTEQNFKGVLKERLEMLGLKNPIYETEEYKAEASEEPVTSGISTKLPNLSINQEAVKEHLDLKSESISTSAQPPSGQEPVHVPVPVQPDSPASQRKKSKIDCPEIDELVNVYNLKPPHVNVENMKYDQNVKCTVTINLEKCTCANKQGYDSKKEAIRKAYLLFGCAVGILDPSSDEKTCSALVKQHFSQRSLILPQEDVEGSVKPFYCSLKNITYDVRYDGQGSSEGEAKLLAFQNALRALSPLFDYASLPGADSPEEVQNQLSSMLNGAGQKEPVTDLKSMEQASIQLSFCDYTLKCTCQSSKKAARNHLSERILGLLGVKTDNNASLRNSLDEWFKKQNLPKPVFEDIEEALGAKATFSVQLTCCCPGWEDSWETAKSKLLQELKLRFRFLNDKNN